MFLRSCIYAISLIVLFQSVNCFFRLPFFGLPKKIFTFDELSETSSQPISTGWIRQKVDHFDPTNNATWKNRFMINIEYYFPGAPVFLMMGGEGPISTHLLHKTALAEYGKMFNALCIVIEHRYFGPSQLFPNLEPKNLKYLKIDQVLADAAHLIKVINNNYELHNPKWITFGGSYSGSLAIWMREKYPNLVHGTVASSPPINTIVNFYQYFDTVSQIYYNYSTKCGDAIKHAMHRLENALDSPKGYKIIHKTLRLCHRPSLSTEQKKTYWIYKISDEFSHIAQYNGDNMRQINKISQVCNIMDNEAIGSPLKRLRKLYQVIFRSNSHHCDSATYDGYLNFYRNRSLFAPAVTGGSSMWVYLLCDQLGQFQSSTNPGGMFGNRLTLHFYLNLCREIFEPKFSLEYSEKTSKYMIQKYGGLHPNTTNVISIEGTADPWKALCLSHSPNPGIEVVIINGTAHVADFYLPSPSDPPSLKAARTKTFDFLKKLVHPWQPVLIDIYSSSLESLGMSSSKKQSTGINRSFKNLIPNIRFSNTKLKSTLE